MELIRVNAVGKEATCLKGERLPPESRGSLEKLLGKMRVGAHVAHFLHVSEVS